MKTLSEKDCFDLLYRDYRVDSKIVPAYHSGAKNPHVQKEMGYDYKVNRVDCDN